MIIIFRSMIILKSHSLLVQSLQLLFMNQQSKKNLQDNLVFILLTTYFLLFHYHLIYSFILLFHSHLIQVKYFQILMMKEKTNSKTPIHQILIPSFPFWIPSFLLKSLYLEDQKEKKYSKTPTHQILIPSFPFCIPSFPLKSL